MGQGKNVTFNDIAKYTHFSKTTISRYFNNPDSLTPQNQEIISNALLELNYQENKVARILAKGRSEFIGIMLPNLFNHYYSAMLNELLSTYETFGYKFLVFAGNENEAEERRYIQELLAYKIEGLIILSHTIPSKELERLQLPVVAIEREDQFISSVNTDNYAGGVQAVELLADCHCDIYIHINSPVSPDIPAYGRLQGFLDTCSKKQLNHQVIYQEPFTHYETLQNGLRHILSQLEETYAGQKKGLFVSNDTYANILINLLVKKYGRLPDDFLIVGFDDSPIAAESVIPISTVGQQIGQIAKEAVSLLVQQINERKKKTPDVCDTPTHKVVAPILIERETTPNKQ